jgi:hypothetical protein
MAHPVIAAFRKEWPAAFAGPLLDKLSGNAKRWTTTQNERSRGEIPAECFIPGRPTIVLRDPFLDWWEEKLLAARQVWREEKLSDARQTPRTTPLQRRPASAPAIESTRRGRGRPRKYPLADASPPAGD